MTAFKIYTPKKKETKNMHMNGVSHKLQGKGCEFRQATMLSVSIRRCSPVALPHAFLSDLVPLVHTNIFPFDVG